MADPILPGDRVVVHLVPWPGVQLAREQPPVALGRPLSDGRAAAADLVSNAYGAGSHDLVMVAVPAGTGTTAISVIGNALRARFS